MKISCAAVLGYCLHTFVLTERVLHRPVSEKYVIKVDSEKVGRVIWVPLNIAPVLCLVVVAESHL